MHISKPFQGYRGPRSEGTPTVATKPVSATVPVAFVAHVVMFGRSESFHAPIYGPQHADEGEIGTVIS